MRWKRSLRGVKAVGQEVEQSEILKNYAGSDSESIKN